MIMANTGTKNRLLALLIALAMCAALLPLAALADTETLDDGTAVQTVTTDGLTEITITISSEAVETATAAESAYTLPVTIAAARTAEEADTITIKLPESESYPMFSLPVSNFSDYTELVIVSGDEDNIGYELYAGNIGLSIESDVSIKVIDPTVLSEPTYTPPTANTLTYTGEAQALISAGTAEGGTMYYSLDGEEWTTDIPIGTDASTYTVYYRVLGDEGYSDIEAASLTVTIAARRTSSGGGGNPDPVTVTNTVTNGDGSATTTVTGTDGTVTETTVYIDGITVTKTTVSDGEAAYTVYISDEAIQNAADADSVIVLPVEPITVAESIDSISSSADNSYDNSVSIYTFYGKLYAEVPSRSIIGKGTLTTVPINIRSDGSTEIIKFSSWVDDKSNSSNSYYVGNFPTADNYIVMMLDGSATLVLADNAKEYGDVTKDDWYSDAVDFVSAREIMVGTGDDVFDPDSSMTRGMVVQTVYNLDTGTESGNSLSNYATDDPFYREAVDWAADVGIVAGYDDGSFNGDNDITREQLATMLYRYAEYIDCDTSPLSSLSQYTDESSVSTYAQEALQWAVGAGIIEGMDDGTLNSNGTATRAQVAAVLERFIKFTVGAA